MKDKMKDKIDISIEYFSILSKLRKTPALETALAALKGWKYILKEGSTTCLNCAFLKDKLSELMEKKMKKPEKKELGIQIRCCTGEKIGCQENDIIEGYNKAIQDYKEFLPDIATIGDLITTLHLGLTMEQKFKIAKALAERIGK